MSGILIIQFLILTFVISGVIIFFLKKILFDSTQGAVNRLNKETEDVRAKQAELNEKIKQANEELAKRRDEADALVAKMTEEANEKAMEEREKVITKARSDSEEIITKAQKSRDDMRKVLEKEMEMKAMDFTVILLETILSEKNLDALNQSLIDDFVLDLEKLDMEVINDEIDTANVISAMPLTDQQRNRLSDVIQKKLTRPIKIESTVDPEIISGILLKFGNLKLNATLQQLLRDHGVALKEKIEKGLLKSGKSQ